MQITLARPVVPALAPFPAQKPPTDPAPSRPSIPPRDVLGRLIADARAAATLALVSTTPGDRLDPTRPSSIQRAHFDLGRAVALVDAAYSVQPLVPDVLFNHLVLKEPLQEASELIAAALNRSPQQADPAAIAQARQLIARSLVQFDYVMTKFWPS